MKKIVFITREGYRLPGARVRCYNFSQELARQGFETEVLSFADTLGAFDGERESRMGLAEKLALNWRALRRLRKEKDAVFYLQRFNYHSLAPYLAHRMDKTRLILDLDDWELRENPRYYLGFYPSSKAHWCISHIARRSVFCVAASRFLEQFLASFNRTVYYIPTGVDADRFRPSLNRTREGRFVFSWVGTLHRREYIRNILLALAAFRMLRTKYGHVYFEIMGSGIYERELRAALAQDADPHVVFRGWEDPDRMPEYLAGIDAGLLPTAEDNKFNRSKSPTKLFEYMAMAKPVIATDSGEARQIIRDGACGLLAHDREGFAEKMRLLVDDAALCRNLGEAARRRIEKDYSLTVLGTQLASALHACCT